MTDITLTDTQAAAVRQIKEWFLSGAAMQQVFRLFGFAGTGKTTITKYAIAELGLSMEAGSPDVRFAAYTGKASLVMRRAGTPARTIHSLIYCVSEATEQEIKAAKDKLDTLETAARNLSGLERILADAQIQTLRMQIKEMKLPRFHLNENSEVRDCKLIVIDEVSMVGPEIAADLLSFEKPILCLGDPGQLPPIRGEGFFTEAEPDVLLTEIHRQAAESAIIRLATMAREGRWIPYGRHDDNVWKMTKRDVSPEQMLLAEQVICGRNATRLELNSAMRAAAGHGGMLPDGPSDKTICLRNDNARGLINGQFLSLDNIEAIDDRRFRAIVRTDKSEVVGGLDNDGQPNKLWCYAGHFADHQQLDPERHERDWKIKKTLKMVESTFGYAITVHKAQGSAFDPVIVYDDHLGRTEEDRRRWLYTACTRAESRLLILD